MELQEVGFTFNLDSTLQIMQRQGLLLTSCDPGGKPNAMTIGWGTVGVIWGKPVFAVLVRPSRYTFGNIEKSGEFVVSVPTDEMQEECMFCGTVSGRGHDKLDECKFTATPGKKVAVPLIDQCRQHYECKVVHTNEVVERALDGGLRKECYPRGDFHRIYYGEILRTTVRK